jgi:hypothetical protein
MANAEGSAVISLVFVMLCWIRGAAVCRVKQSWPVLVLLKLLREERC